MGRLVAAATKEDLSYLEQQGLIQYFEYTIDLAWKTIHDILFERGYPDIDDPDLLLKRAFADGIITSDEGWLTMWSDR